MEVSIKKVKDPFCFWAVPTDHCKDSRFLRLRKEICAFYSNENMMKKMLVQPSPQTRCIIRIGEKEWKRCKIKKLITTCYGCNVECYLVDEGGIVVVAPSRVFAAPKWVWSVADQSMKLGLHGILPCRLLTNYSQDEVIISPSKSWDLAATAYFKKIIRNAGDVAVIEIIKKDRGNQFWVRMEVLEDMSYVCVNDVMMVKQFCKKKLDETNQESASSQGKENCFRRGKSKDKLYSVDDEDTVKAKSAASFLSEKNVGDNNDSAEIKKSNDVDCRFYSNFTRVKNQGGSSRRFLIQGNNVPQPIALFCDSPFPESITRYMESMRYRGPTCVQGYAWSAAVSRRDFFVISPSGDGKTLSYVAPLVASLQQRKANVSTINPINRSVIFSTSPKIIVLCSSWKNVQAVSCVFKRLLVRATKLHSVVGISGGPDAEAAKAVDLLTDCSVLVCSPCTLVRLCSSHHLAMSRVEVLVFDDADLLMEEFTSEVRQIMTFLATSLHDVDRLLTQRATKPQMMGFGNKMTKGIHSFMATCMDEKAILYIGDPVEAALYKPIYQEVIVCGHASLFERLVDLVMFLHQKQATFGGQIAIFVSSAQAAHAVAETLQSIGLASVYELDELNREFEDMDTSSFLVVDDSLVESIEPTNVQNERRRVGCLL